MEPIFTNDAIVFGILMSSLGFVFYTESKTSGFWHKFYKIVPGLFLAYMVPALFTTVGLIAPEWITIKENGDVIFGLYVFPVLVQAMAKVIDARRKINGDNEYNQYKWFDYLDMKIATLGLTESDPITACRELLEPNNVQNSIIAQLYESSH
jgi:hypothetical protein